MQSSALWCMCESSNLLPKPRQTVTTKRQHGFLWLFIQNRLRASTLWTTPGLIIEFMGKPEMNKVSQWSSWVGFQEIQAPPVLLIFPRKLELWGGLCFSHMVCKLSETACQTSWLDIGVKPQYKTLWEEIFHSRDEQNDLELFSACCQSYRMLLSPSPHQTSINGVQFSIPESVVLSQWTCRWGQRSLSL